MLRNEIHDFKWQFFFNIDNTVKQNPDVIKLDKIFMKKIPQSKTRFLPMQPICGGKKSVILA